ncbi:hypothetical protein [Streptomyces sp. NPDC053560]|uniref:hypothetical protein n=1 Tax=Streptomyces sp. NPDC053560 TaxID=3365711 RepID=UPI0037D92CD8
MAVKVVEGEGDHGLAVAGIVRVVLKKLWPYWGLITFVVAVSGWLTADTGPVGLTALFVLSLLWFLVQAPMPCGAGIRKADQTCRRNGHGLLRGCHLEQRKWQRARNLLLRPGLRRKVNELFPNPLTGLAGPGAIDALIGTVTNTVMTLMGRGSG